MEIILHYFIYYCLICLLAHILIDCVIQVTLEYIQWCFIVIQKLTTVPTFINYLLLFV